MYARKQANDNEMLLHGLRVMSLVGSRNTELLKEKEQVSYS
jgi:hypothetical protein